MAVNKSDVICSNQYLTTAQQRINAEYIYQFLLNKGWTINAIAGMLGNMESESKINPGLWQSMDEGNTSGGFGLVQWTPATKLINWCTSNGYEYTDIDAQLNRILWELENGEQYYKTDAYPLTFREFSKSTASAYYLAGAFLYNYERPKTPLPEQRGNQAEVWFDYLSTLSTDFPTGGEGSGGSGGSGSGSGSTITKKKMPLYMLYLATRK